MTRFRRRRPGGAIRRGRGADIFGHVSSLASWGVRVAAPSPRAGLYSAFALQRRLAGSDSGFSYYPRHLVTPLLS